MPASRRRSKNRRSRRSSSGSARRRTSRRTRTRGSGLESCSRPSGRWPSTTSTRAHPTRTSCSRPTSKIGPRSPRTGANFRRIEWNDSDSSPEAKPYSRHSHPWARERGIMEFRNERTWQNAIEMNRTEEFHAAYEAAVDKVRADFGQKHPMIIGGQEVWSKTTFPDTSPADTKLVLGQFQKGGRTHAKEAVKAAKAAFAQWSGTAYADRVHLVQRAADLISQGKFALAALMSFENGKNRYEAKADVDEATDLMRWYAAEMLRNQGYERPMGTFLPGETTRSILKPYGVWAVVAPFNFVTGPGVTVAQELLDHPDVDGFVFTGSRAVGMKALQTFTRTRPKPIITEMGGKNPAIVTASADLDKAAIGVMRAAFGYGGQKCSACSRVLVDKGVKDAFVAKLLSETEKIKVGDPTVRDVYLGPVINEAAVATYENAIAEIQRSKGKILSGGKALKGTGHFVEPTIVDGLPRDHRINKEELFVPILSIVPVDGLEDAIQVANDVDYGLTAGIFSREPAEIRQFFVDVQAGVLYANRTAGATTGAVVGVQPFGGWKMSGISGKSAGGHHYLHQFLREQSQSEYS